MVGEQACLLLAAESMVERFTADSPAWMTNSLKMEISLSPLITEAY